MKEYAKKPQERQYKDRSSFYGRLCACVCIYTYIFTKWKCMVFKLANRVPLFQDKTKQLKYELIATCLWRFLVVQVMVILQNAVQWQLDQNCFITAYTHLHSFMAFSDMTFDWE